MELINFSAWVADQKTLTAADLVLADDQIIIGKKVNALRDGSQYQAFSMSIAELLNFVEAGVSLTEVLTVGAIMALGQRITSADEKSFVQVNNAIASLVSDVKLTLQAPNVELGKPNGIDTLLTCYNASTNFAVSIQSGATAADYTLILPTAQAVGASVLVNDGTGVLSWGAGATGSFTTVDLKTVTVTNGVITSIV